MLYFIIYYYICLSKTHTPVKCCRFIINLPRNNSLIRCRHRDYALGPHTFSMWCVQMTRRYAITAYLQNCSRTLPAIKTSNIMFVVPPVPPPFMRNIRYTRDYIKNYLYYKQCFHILCYI